MRRWTHFAAFFAGEITQLCVEEFLQEPAVVVGFEANSIVEAEMTVDGQANVPGEGVVLIRHEPADIRLPSGSCAGALGTNRASVEASAQNSNMPSV